MRKSPTLESLQRWFGQAISQPLPGNYRDNPLAPTLRVGDARRRSAAKLRREAENRLREKGGFTGFQRLGVYNEQYWFRLVSIMQSEYPCALHVLGLRAFNVWVVRYLQAHPPASPYLAQLDARFPEFMRAAYRGKNRSATHQAVAHDFAYSHAFDAPAGRPLSIAGLTGAAAAAAAETAASEKLCLAPHAALLRVDFGFQAYRSKCLRDESLEKPIGLRPLKSPVYLLIHRDENLTVVETVLGEAASSVLQAFAQPARVGEAFQSLDKKLRPGLRAEVEKNLASWFQGWVAMGWIVLADEASSRRNGSQDTDEPARPDGGNQTVGESKSGSGAKPKRVRKRAK